MRHTVQPFSVDDAGHRVETGSAFYLSPNELDALKESAFVRVWTRPELLVPPGRPEPTIIEITDPWGHVLFEIDNPIKER